MKVLSPVQPGDRAPACCGMSIDQRFYSFEEQFGRPAVLILAGAGAVTGLRPVIDEFAACLRAFAARNVDVLLLVGDNPKILWTDALDSVPLRIIDCGTFLPLCGVGVADAVILVLDRNLRVALRIRPAEAPSPTPSPSGRSRIASACLACLDEMPHEEPRDARMPAPVIVLPNLLERSLCRSLIDRFESSPSTDGEVARIDAQGIVRSVIDHAKKHRRDLLISPNDDLHETLAATLLGRCAPEIAKAFQVNVSHIDRILVARYSEAGGWFHRHRDDGAANVAFRQFAISVNLNAEEYEGGHLNFPEYNDHRYSPPTGGGIIFSTSILHAAAAIKSGRRYVLLTFFHTDAAERRRQSYIARVGL
jgi:predicted 2-oxoglutarate/Fe(II)-dependent dioxygenase YbiX